MSRWLVISVALLGGCNQAREVRDRLTPEEDTGPKVEQDEDVFPDPPPGPGGLRPGRYRIVQVGATVARRTARGTAWDLLGGAGADPEVEVHVDGTTVGSCKGAVDSTRAVCTIGHDLQLRADTTITMVVTDDDLTGDERIGEATLTGLVDSGRVGVRMKMQVSQQVTSGFVELVKLAEPPGVWARHRWRAIGIGAGLGVALLALLAWRRRLLPPSEGDASGERPRRRAPTAYLLATLAGLLGCVLGFLIGMGKLAGGPAGAVPAALGACAITLAIAACLHEGDLRWRTLRATGFATAALAVEPMFAAYPYLGYVVIGAAALLLLLFFVDEL